MVSENLFVSKFGVGIFASENLVSEKSPRPYKSAGQGKVRRNPSWSHAACRHCRATPVINLSIIDKKRVDDMAPVFGAAGHLCALEPFDVQVNINLSVSSALGHLCMYINIYMYRYIYSAYMYLFTLQIF